MEIHVAVSHAASNISVAFNTAVCRLHTGQIVYICTKYCAYAHLVEHFGGIQIRLQLIFVLAHAATYTHSPKNVENEFITLLVAEVLYVYSCVCVRVNRYRDMIGMHACEQHCVN